ncbi:MAG: hypothetical protein GPJ54_10525 [Candidatus Heimdallarchaeota archaeon]|nr:hypothetical protein [Candidatus Heimdallarchaeota archaeon]
MSTFRSTSFYLAQWANKTEKAPEAVRKSPLLLDIVQSTDTREVCKGEQCALYHNSKTNSYENFGGCVRKSLCTETRIIKDAYFLKTGSVSATLNSISHPKQLKNWE